MPELSAEARNLNWLVANFSKGTPGVAHAIVLSADGLPIGLQLIGKPFDEATVLRAAYTYEQATDWHTRRPPLDGNAGTRERGNAARGTQDVGR